MMLGKPPVSGCPANLDNSRTRAYCACNRCGWGLSGHAGQGPTALAIGADGGCLDIFFSRLLFLSSFPLSL